MKVILLTLFLWNCPIGEGSEETAVTQDRFNALMIRNHELASRVPCIIPINKFSHTRISSLFAMRPHPVLSKIRHHNGLDIACEKQAILAAGTGVVSRTGMIKDWEITLRSFTETVTKPLTGIYHRCYRRKVRWSFWGEI